MDIQDYKKPWQGLSEQDINEIKFNLPDMYYWVDVVRATEKRLKDKNMTITVVGVGLIGGSLMVDLRKRGFATRIIGVDTNVNHQNIALLCGLVDENDTLENAI